MAEIEQRLAEHRDRAHDTVDARFVDVGEEPDAHKHSCTSLRAVP